MRIARAHVAGQPLSQGLSYLREDSSKLVSWNVEAFLGPRFLLEDTIAVRGVFSVRPLYSNTAGKKSNGWSGTLLAVFFLRPPDQDDPALPERRIAGIAATNIAGRSRKPAFQ
jgi:hypothetical protein